MSNITVGSLTGTGRNVISGNGNNGAVAGTQGVFVHAASASMSGVQIVNNYFGVTPSGTAALGNYIGVGFSSTDAFTSNNTLIDRNVISGSAQFGINLGTSGATGTVITGNVIGLNAAGTAALGNVGGIHVPAPNTVIGGTTAGSGNVIAGNTSTGINATTGATGTQILGNLIGTNASGAAGLGNFGHGISITNTSNVVVGSVGAGRNVISGNQQSGIAAAATTTAVSATQIVGNYIGVTPDGTTALANLGSGIGLGLGSSTTPPVSGTLVDRNVIAGNSLVGVINNAGGSITITGNYIGTNASGTAAIPNGQNGILLSDIANSTIGGTTDQARNLVSGNVGSGILMMTSTTGGNAASANTIAGNYIGTDVTGATAIPNGGSGVQFTTSAGGTNVNNVVGGMAAGAGNLISGNSISGIQISSGVSGTQIQGNLIGTDATGSSAIPNSSRGVNITNSSNNTIGGTAASAGNLIAFNGSNGVAINSGTGNAIRGNSIHSNSGIGIDLGGAGATANDVGDGDVGPNNFQNFPLIASAQVGSTLVSGTLNSTAGSPFVLDFFASPGPTCVAGQGRRYLGSATTANTDGSGNVSFNFTLSAASTPGELITATATDADGNTSEFSACQMVVAAPNLAVTTARAPASPLIGSPITYTLTVTNNGTAPATGVTLVDTLPASAAFVSTNNPACVHVSGVVTCSLGTLGISASVAVDIVAEPNVPESITNSASVSANETDSNPADNVSQDVALVSAYGSCTVASFSGPFTYTTDGVTPAAVVSGDFNEDGFVDVIATEQGDNTVALMLGNGTGAYPTVTHIPAGTSPVSIAKGDFNEDNNLDFVVSSSTTANLYQVLGNGDGTFQTAAALALPFTPSNVAAQDLNHDGNLDLVASPLAGGANVAVLLGDGLGGYGTPTPIAAGTSPVSAVLGDFNGDTHIDIAAPNAGTTTVSVLFGVGNGTFGAPVQVTLPGLVQRVRSIDDVSGDNKPDLAVTVSLNGAPNSLYLLVNDGSGGFLAPVEIVGPVGVIWAAAGDLNKDGTRDLVALVTDAETVLVLHGTGAGAFGPATTYIAAEVRNQFELADLNSDGRLDIVGPSGEPASIFVFLNTCASTDVADVSIAITGPTTGSAGDVVTITLTATNNGPATANDVVAQLTATIPAEFISSTCPAMERLECVAPSLASGASVSFDITVRLYRWDGIRHRVSHVAASRSRPRQQYRHAQHGGRTGPADVRGHQHPG